MIGALARSFTALVLSWIVNQQLVPFFLTQANHQDLNNLRELMATEKVTPVIDKLYRLSEVPEAIPYLEAGHARGKVVITFGT